MLRLNYSLELKTKLTLSTSWLRDLVVGLKYVISHKTNIIRVPSRKNVIYLRCSMNAIYCQVICNEETVTAFLLQIRIIYT